MNIKVEDAIARAQTPAPMLNPDEENLRQQVSADIGLFPSHIAKLGLCFQVTWPS